MLQVRRVHGRAAGVVTRHAAAAAAIAATPPCFDGYALIDAFDATPCYR